MAANIDGVTINSRLCTRLVRSRTEEKPDEPTSWHWAGNLYFDMVTGYRRLVGSSEGENEEKNL